MKKWILKQVHDDWSERCADSNRRTVIVLSPFVKLLFTIVA